MPVVVAGDNSNGAGAGGGGAPAAPPVPSTGGEPPAAGPHEVPDRIWQALKKHIIRERQRKREEHEAEVEEERLRKEREARERQDVMTLGETRDQIQQLEHKLTKLREEKHQLFLQLKKVLNEDDNRKRLKDANEMMANMVQSQIFLPPSVSQGNPNIGRPPLSAHMLNKGGGGMKRGRSPSPPYVMQSQSSPHTSTPYMHIPHHKQQHTSPYQGPPPHKSEDGRCRDVARAVLWNKPSQYGSGSGTPYYVIPLPDQRSVPLSYSTPHYHPHHIQHHTPPKQVQSYLELKQDLKPYHLDIKQEMKPYHMDIKQEMKPYHLDIKQEIKKEPPVVIGLNESHQPTYLNQPPPCIPPSSSSVSPVPLFPPPPLNHHQSVLPKQHNSVQTAKPGGITTGYPVRQQSPSVQNPNMFPSRHRY